MWRKTAPFGVLGTCVVLRWRCLVGGCKHRSGAQKRGLKIAIDILAGIHINYSINEHVWIELYGQNVQQKKAAKDQI